MIKSRRMGCVGLAARMEMWKIRAKFRKKNLNVRDSLGDMYVDGRIILQFIFKKLIVWVWTGIICVRTGNTVLTN
jgi:hypothetical protein